MAESQFLSISDVADILAVSRWTVSRMLEDGEIPYVPARGTPRIDRADFDAWIADKKAASLAKAQAKKAKEEAPPAPIRRRGRPRKQEVASAAAAIS